MQKIQKIRSILEEKQIDAVLVKSRSSKRYLGVLTGSDVRVLMTGDKLYQTMDGRYGNEAGETTSGFIPMVHEQGNSYLGEVVRLLGSHTRIGIEAGRILVREYLSVQEYGLETVLLKHKLKEVCRCKDAQEIALVHKMYEITDATFQETISTIRIGMKETGVSALLQYLAIKDGTNAITFDMIIANSIRGSMPRGRPSEEAFKAHEFITIDFGITYQGYQFNMTKTVCVQEPKPELKKIYDIVLEVQCADVDLIRAGIRGNDMDSCMRGIIQGHGYGPYFTRGLGHGINVEGGELPLLSAGSDTILEEGMIMPCEPDICVPGLGGMRIEDDVPIENGHGVPLNTTTREFIILKSNGYEV